MAIPGIITRPSPRGTLVFLDPIARNRRRMVKALKEADRWLKAGSVVNADPFLTQAADAARKANAAGPGGSNVSRTIESFQVGFHAFESLEVYGVDRWMEFLSEVAR